MRLRLLFSTGLLTLLIVIILYSLKYPFGARLFPWVIAIPAALLMLMELAKEIFQPRDAAPAELDPEEKKRRNRAYGSIIAWMVGFLAMIYVLGFLVGIPLFLFLYLKTNGFPWFRSLRLAAGLILSIYLIFSLLMNMHLYPGLW
ncbi:MAG: tripartite tricarboxylate transporter TctB family protein [Desulfobacterales bacterium]|nr:tripartite tricarboxylate transporter TctB family protein [Desulfobacterales bacterium]